MIEPTKKTMFYCKCDSCGKKWEDTSSGVYAFDDLDNMMYAAKESDWLQAHGLNMYCPECYWYDDENNLKIKILEDKRPPMSCKGVKCMQKGCDNLASHKVGEENPWSNVENSPNNEAAKNIMFDRGHNLMTYLCHPHFDKLMERDIDYTKEDNRFDD